MRESLGVMMAGVAVAPDTKPKLVGYCTVKYQRPDGLIAYRFHHTDIVVHDPIANDYTLSTGGWRTPTTKSHINAIAPVRIWTDRGEWYINEKQPFFDGVRVSNAGVVLNGHMAIDAELSPQEVRRRQKLILKMTRQLQTLKQLPEPGPGDCWICTLQRENTGKARFNSHEHQSGPGQPDCLLSHIEEGYLHGTLIYKALEWAGYRDPGVIWHTEQQQRKAFHAGQTNHKPDFASRALRRYLRRKLGVG